MSSLSSMIMCLSGVLIALAEPREDNLLKLTGPTSKVLSVQFSNVLDQTAMLGLNHGMVTTTTMLALHCGLEASLVVAALLFLYLASLMFQFSVKRSTENVTTTIVGIFHGDGNPLMK